MLPSTAVCRCVSKVVSKVCRSAEVFDYGAAHGASPVKPINKCDFETAVKRIYSVDNGTSLQPV